MILEKYFDIINENNAYILGLIIFNIKNINLDDNETALYIQSIDSFSKNIHDELKYICCYIDIDSAVIKSTYLIDKIYSHFNTRKNSVGFNFDINHFLKNNKKTFSIEFLKTFFEKFGKINKENKNVTISTFNKKNLTAFANFFDIPCSFTEKNEKHMLVYKNSNVLDLLGIIYYDSSFIINSSLYIDFLNLLNEKRPIINFLRIRDDAIIPTKANYSDVGYDITALSIHKKINDCCILCNTGIKLEIPISYYVEIIPRSSIIKTGYMLANSIGIIDCSYKGELLIALVKVSKDADDIKFPIKCCQLIVRKQIFPDFVETNEQEISKRNEGGFGSSDQ